DPTLDPTFVTRALAYDPATIWQLVSGGLTSLPQDVARLQDFIETVWNQYVVQGTTILGNTGGYLSNNTTSGGVDTAQPAPSYQPEVGHAPTTSDPPAETGRGVPDVSAVAGGNLRYLVPDSSMTTTSHDFGTSASTPLWASLAVQINYVFKDQGL